MTIYHQTEVKMTFPPSLFGLNYATFAFDTLENKQFDAKWFSKNEFTNRNQYHDPEVKMTFPPSLFGPNYTTSKFDTFKSKWY